jgi:hypothetical protein
MPKNICIRISHKITKQTHSHSFVLFIFEILIFYFLYFVISFCFLAVSNFFSFMLSLTLSFFEWLVLLDRYLNRWKIQTTINFSCFVLHSVLSVVSLSLSLWFYFPSKVNKLTQFDNLYIHIAAL